MIRIKRLFFRLNWRHHGASELATRRGITWIVQPYTAGDVRGYTWVAFTGMPPCKVAQSDSLYFDKRKVKRIVYECALALENSKP